MHVWVSKGDVNAFALCDLFKLFLHLCTNIGTAIEPGGVQLDKIYYCFQVVLVIAQYIMEVQNEEAYMYHSVPSKCPCMGTWNSRAKMWGLETSLILCVMYTTSSLD